MCSLLQAGEVAQAMSESRKLAGDKAKLKGKLQEQASVLKAEQVKTGLGKWCSRGLNGAR